MNTLPTTALLDTNILLLWLVAGTDASLLRTFKRVQTFELADISLLRSLLLQFTAFITTPHVLAEVSNFVDQAPAYRRIDLAQGLKRFIDTTDEVALVAKEIAGRAEFLPLGLSDAGLTALCSNHMIITSDFRLCGKIVSAGGHCINFNHYRSSRLL